MKIQLAVGLLALEFGLMTASASLCSAQNPLTAVLESPLQPQTPPAVAQALPAPAAPGLAGKVTKISGKVTVARGGATGPLKVGDPIYKGDQIFTDCSSSAFVLFTDNTIQLKLAQATEVTIDEYVYNPNSNWHNKIRFSLQKGSFEYINGVIGKPEEQDVQIDTPLGAIVDRGTYFICEYDGTAKTLQIYVSIGEVDFTPAGGAARPTGSGQGPVWVKIAPPPAPGMFGTWVLPLTQPQYSAIEAQLFSAQPAPTSACALCPKAANAKALPLNIIFTSFTTAITSEDLCNVYQGLYIAGLDSSGKATPDSFAARMDALVDKEAVVDFYVLDGDEKDSKYGDFTKFQSLSTRAYANATNTEANLKKGQTPDASTSIQSPNDNKFIMAILSPKGRYEVVASVQALMWGYYNSSSPLDLLKAPRKDLSPLEYSIQMAMAYELGTNIFNMAEDSKSCEQLVEPDTNRFVCAEFPRFPENCDSETGSAFYGNVNPPPGTVALYKLPQHWVVDLGNPQTINKPINNPTMLPKDVEPQGSTGSFDNVSGQEVKVSLPYIGNTVAPPPAGKCIALPTPQGKTSGCQDRAYIPTRCPAVPQ